MAKKRGWWEQFEDRTGIVFPKGVAIIIGVTWLFAMFGQQALKFIGIKDDTEAVKVMFFPTVLVLWLLLSAVQKVKEKLEEIESSGVSAGSPAPTARLLSLEKSADEILAGLDSVAEKEKVVINFLGFNLTQAWAHICRLGAEHPTAKNIEFQVLCLDPDATNPLPPAVAEGRSQVRASFDKIQKQLDSVVDRLRKEKRKLKITIKGYSVVPYVGGWRLHKPDRLTKHFICFNGARIKLGWVWPEKYLGIGTPKKRDETSEYVALAYDGFFDELYEDASARVLFEYEV